MTEILDFPISGGGCITQLGLLCNLLEANRNYRPSICMGSSGGCVATHIAVAANFIPEYIVNIASRLSYRDYIQKEYTPTPLRPLWRNHFYRNAKDGIINELVIPALSQEVETWIGAFNKRASKAALFCNRSRFNCQLKFDQEAYGTSPVVYLDGNTPEIISSIHASINIPLFMPEVNIRGVNYSDGGERYASPISSLRNEVKNLHSFHLIYICSDNLDSCETKRRTNMFNIAMASMAELIKNVRLADRQVARDLVGENCVTISDLSQYFELRRNHSKTMLEIYPEVPNNVDILNFDSAAVSQCLKYSSINMRARMWW